MRSLAIVITIVQSFFLSLSLLFLSPQDFNVYCCVIVLLYYYYYYYSMIFESC